MIMSVNQNLGGARESQALETTLTDQLDRQGQLNAGLTFDEDLRLGTRGCAWPWWPRLEPRLTAIGPASEVDLMSAMDFEHLAMPGNDSLRVHES
jgi:hypothetical protein